MAGKGGRKGFRGIMTTKTTPAEFARAERDAIILDMRLKGMATREISEELAKQGVKLSQSAVWRALDKRLLQTVRPGAEALRELELQRLDKLMTSVWQVAVLGDTQAIMVCLKLIEARAKLQGLYPKEERQQGALVNVNVGQQPEVTLDDVMPLLKSAGFRVVPIDTEGVDVTPALTEGEGEDDDS